MNNLVPVNGPTSNVNVKRLLNHLESNIDNMLSSYVFSLNDQRTRSTIESTIIGYMQGFKDQNTIADFRVTCDNSNNLPINVMNGELLVDINIQPTSSYTVHTISAKVTGGHSMDIDPPLYDHPYCEDY
jgi:phage tail sheath protein FI